ncbi:plant UBX domain-containing protein 4 [Dendrobium catenatum]|uniref:UBA and UBX domain-containing protein n=1 Tax=Dendrobium catenatum TaxID=906689 RepID=A0A2I0XA58_9ASPA|nr:plant UBX domain-containing protein 4 [Dendrobium catenatum]PKU84808.1 UBA and UBX domain-containing protein [Dendrobium catenatum]
MEASGDGKQEDLVQSFCGITSCSREEARFFLESHGWLLDSALHSYFENSAGGEDETFQQEQRHPETLASDSRVLAAAASAENRDPLLTARSPVSMSSSKDKKPATRSSGSGPAIRTLADLNRRSSGPGSGSDSDEPQEYYTGGEKSGMLVQDPTSGNHDVDAIFDQARQMGALQGPFENQLSSSSRNFTGTGRLLSGESVPSVVQPPENVVHNIYFWRNGFTVDDGPLRRFDDPANASFLESIKKSECPKELEPTDRRSAVHVNLIRREENCPEPVKRLSPFQGVGRTLGGGSSSSEPPPSSSSPPTPFSGLSVDESLPLTSIQLRLADGTRMVSRFNIRHTIGDIRAFIDASRPGAARNYTLQTVGFPPKQLTDVSHTIEQAGLANSVVIQKF